MIHERTADAISIAGTGGWGAGMIGAHTHPLIGLIGAVAIGAFALWYTPHVETIVRQWESEQPEGSQ